MKNKETYIIPFSNGSEFWNWRENNCEICDSNTCDYTNYDNADEPHKDDCIFKIAMELGSISEGTIPLNTAEWVGYNGSVLNAKCNMFNIQLKPVTINHNAWRQLSLF